MFEDFPVTYIPWLVLVAAVGIVVFIAWQFFLKEHIEAPIHNARSYGRATITLNSLGLVNEGEIYSARDYMKDLWEKLINSAPAEQRDELSEARDLMLQTSVIAQKPASGKTLYLMQGDPLDQKNHLRNDLKNRFGPDTAHYILNVEGCTSYGKLFGWNLVSVWFKGEKLKVGKDEQKTHLLLERVLGYLEVAAVSQDLISHFKDEIKAVRTFLREVMGDNAKKTADLDRALSALSKELLTQPKTAMVKGAWKEAMKQWFTWPQFLTAGLGWFIAPYIQSMAGLQLQPPQTAYFALLIALAGFFIIPFGKRLFGRWL